MTGELASLPVDKIQPNPQQPRLHFDETKMQELADSIAAQGVLQPIEVERNGDGYIIHHGERRWRAAQMVGLPHIPAVIVEPLDERTRALRAIIENVMREDLDPISEGLGYLNLIEMGYTVSEIVRTTGRSRPTVENRLAWANEESTVVQQMVVVGDLALDVRVLKALQELPLEAREQLAPSLAGHSVNGVLKAVAVVVESIGKPPAPAKTRYTTETSRPPKRPYAVTVALGNGVPHGLSEASYTAVQTACNHCPFSGFPAEETCNGCPLTNFVRLHNGLGVQ